MPGSHSDGLVLTMVRHAEAANISAGIDSDSERPLTARGMSDALAIGRIIALLDNPPSMVITSPLLRAVQTGTAVAGNIDRSLLSSVSQDVAPGFEPRALLEQLLTLRRAGVKSLLAVGHQPDIGKFITYVIAGRGTSSLGLGPGTAARLSIRFTGAHPEGILHWLVPPDAARAFLSVQSPIQGKP